MVTSDFRPEVEIRPFRACAMKNMQYTGNPYLWPNRQNYRVIKKIGVEIHNGDVRFFTGSGNIAVLRMRSASGHNCSFIMTWLLGRYHVPQNAFLVFTVLHGMQSLYSNGNSVRPSLCLSNACIVTKRKKAMFRFLYHAKDHSV